VLAAPWQCTTFIDSSRPTGMDDHTFLFVDLVGYTAFTERVGDEAAADVAIAFQSAAAHTAAELGCEVIKQLGDAVMIHGHDAVRVLTLALRLSREMSDEGWCPPLRIGVHSGPAVQRDGDWYGSTVNIAARLADSACAGEILMSVETRDRVAAGTGLTFADRGPRSFKNVTAPLAVFAAAA
jgi:class 3 adenylate cyclase